MTVGRNPAIALGALAAMVALASPAAADPAALPPAASPPPADPPPGIYAPPARPLPPPAYAPPAAYPAPEAYPPPAYPPPAAYPPPPADWAARQVAYEEDSQSALVAVLLDLLIFPPIGNLYAGDDRGTIVTALLFLGGAASIVYGAGHSGCRSETGMCRESALLPVGILMLMGGYVYAPISAAMAVSDHNRDLRQRLGLEPPMSFALAPLPSGAAAALSLRF
jgi:hypothetical protein